MLKKFIFLCAISVAVVSCKSQKEPKITKDGLFAKIETSKGDMIVELYYKATPVTVANFVSLAEGKNTLVADSLKGKKYYNNTIFHRVIKDFMIQGGDRTGTGMGTPGYRFADEFVDSLKFTKKGQLAMANAGPKSNGSQFFITHKETPWLNNAHTIFGQVIDGVQVIDSIANVKTVQADRPEQKVMIKNIEIIRKGSEAKKFNAGKYFEDFINQEAEKERIKAEEAKKKAEGFLSEIKTQMEKAQTYPSGLKVFKIKSSNGKRPKIGDQVMINYAGYLAATGQLFDSNEKQIAQNHNVYNAQRDQMGGYAPMPSIYSPDAQFIAGFRDAILTMNVGDRVRAFIPSALGYGSQGAGGVIPPNADLVFDIEIVE